MVFTIVLISGIGGYGVFTPFQTLKIATCGVDIYTALLNVPTNTVL